MDATISEMAFGAKCKTLHELHFISSANYAMPILIASSMATIYQTIKVASRIVNELLLLLKLV